MRIEEFGLRTSELRDGVRDGVRDGHTELRCMWCRTEVHELQN